MTKNITFTLPAEALEGASEAFLLGDFNNWNPETAVKLEKQKDGSYKTVAKLEEGKTYHYRFLLNDGRWVNDYNAQSYTGVNGLHVDNCVITVPVSKTEETKKVAPAKATPAKEVKAKTPVAAKVETVVAQPAKKAAPAKPTATKAPAAKATTDKTVKAAAPKATAAKTAKPVAAAKKAAPKAKK
ncbi:MAG: isoamylase early set domain-containing protein [Ginsengibacter sp.]|jgi:hypothetical protein